MKKSILTILLLFVFTPIFAHYIWIETTPIGTLNNEHSIKIRFGEYTHGVIEKVNGKSFSSVKDFSVWVIAPNGTKTALQVTPQLNYYKAVFTPTEKGTYTIALDNKKMNVLDFTKYNYTIFKPQYHAKAKVIVGDVVANQKETNSDSIEIVDISKTPFTQNSKVILKVLYKGKPLAKNEVSIFVQDGWTKKATTNKNGEITFKLPFKTTYTLETTFEEKTPGKFKGKDYKLIWHCATYCINL